MSEFEIRTEFRGWQLSDLADTDCCVYPAYLRNAAGDLTAEVCRALLRANAEIKRLTAELAAKDEWTPITSVEQVEGLAAGLYLLDSDMLGVKWKDGHWHFMIYSDHEFRFADADINKSFDSYKLIHAFEQPAAPSIPEGAIENTDKNLIANVGKMCLFVYENGERSLETLETKHHRVVHVEYDGDVFEEPLYFYVLDAKSSLAALEALAKGERSS